MNGEDAARCICCGDPAPPSAIWYCECCQQVVEDARTTSRELRETTHQVNSRRDRMLRYHVKQVHGREKLYGIGRE
jgi:hypothetical protein